MNLPSILDIVIGSIFIYLILSLLASEIQELLATFFQWRPKHLKKSIETMLSGGSQSKGNAKYIVEKLYKDPLINTLNHRAEGNIGESLTRVSESQQSAPSYIPSETFAITLIQALKITELIQRLKKSQNLEPQTTNENLESSLNIVLASYKEIIKFQNHIKNQGKEKEIDRSSKVYKTIFGELQKTYRQIDAQEFESFIKELPAAIPLSLITSLSVLAKRAEIKVENPDEQMDQFKKEIATWFDRSMDRASGVYKRNAKKVAIAIGLLTAISTNTDTFHIASRFSKDSELRDIITTRVSQIPQGADNLQAIKEQVQQAKQDLLESVSLPIGWSDTNLKQQREEQKFWGLDIPFVKQFVGWILSGLAIAMGAPFWFELLNKFINVRNAGPKPASSANNETASHNRSESTGRESSS